MVTCHTTVRAQLTIPGLTVRCVSFILPYSHLARFLAVKTVDEILAKFDRPELTDVLEQV